MFLNFKAKKRNAHVIHIVVHIILWMNVGFIRLIHSIHIFYKKLFTV